MCHLPRSEAKRIRLACLQNALLLLLLLQLAIYLVLSCSPTRLAQSSLNFTGQFPRNEEVGDKLRTGYYEEVTRRLLSWNLAFTRCKSISPATR